MKRAEWCAEGCFSSCPTLVGLDVSYSCFQKWWLKLACRKLFLLALFLTDFSCLCGFLLLAPTQPAMFDFLAPEVAANILAIQPLV